MVPFLGESIRMTTFVQQLLPQSRCAIVNGGKKKLWIHVKVMVHQLHSHMSSTSCGKLCVVKELLLEIGQIILM